MEIKPNKFGKYTRAQVDQSGKPIVTYGETATDIERMTGGSIKIPVEKRLELCFGFKTGKGYRGYVPVFNIFDVEMAKNRNWET